MPMLLTRKSGARMIRSDHHAEIGDWQGLNEKPDDQIIDLAA